LTIKAASHLSGSPNSSPFFSDARRFDRPGGAIWPAN
jgi:hypothetical protein